MRTFNPPSLNRSSVHFLFIVLTLFLAGCSGYQSVSYYGDGIYDDEVIQQPRKVGAPTTNNTQQNNGSYYKSYFADKASQGIQDDYMFTDVDQYQDATPQQNSAGNYQSHGSWGDQVDRINVNVIYNQPFGWNWYYAPFNYGRASFWGYNYHPWYFTFNHHPFYSPYRWGYRNPYWNRWNNRHPYWGNRYHNGNVYRNTPIYSRLNGSRTITRNYSANRSSRNVNYNLTTNTNRTNSSANNRAGVSNNNTKRRTNTRGTTTTRRVSDSNNSTQRYNDADNSTNSSQNKRTTRRYTTERTTSSNNSSYRSSSSSSNASYRRSTPSSSTRSTSSSSTRRSGSSRRR